MFKLWEKTETPEALIDMIHAVELPPFEKKRVCNVRLKSDELDDFCNSQLPKDRVVLNCVALYTVGDGQCFVNGMSRQLKGTSDKETRMELKVIP